MSDEKELSNEKETDNSIGKQSDNSYSSFSTSSNTIRKQEAEVIEKSPATEKLSASQPAGKLETTTQNSTTIQPTRLAEQPVDIDYYINFATNYAQSIDLVIDNSATDCWDNPISITSKTTNVKGNITSRLDRYKNIEGFSSVCIWYEKVGNSFEIYIGYA